MGTSKEVWKCLEELKRRLKIAPPAVVPRDKNLQGMFDLQMRASELPTLLEGIRVIDYEEGPNSDPDGTEGTVWIFCPDVKGETAYVKFKFDGADRVKVLSIHPVEHPPNYPLRQRR